METLTTLAAFVGVKAALFGVGGWAVGAYGKAAVRWAMNGVAALFKSGADKV